MKKTLVTLLALVFVLGVACTAMAAPANPFVDVPAKHWAYGAVAQLAKAGIVDGYGDGTFRGDRAMTRYEMAQVVAKAMARSDKADAQNKALIDKLAVEFAAELNNLGVRVGALEKKAAADTVAITGDFRVRYDKTEGAANSNFRDRFRLNFAGNINEDTTFVGQYMFNRQSIESASAYHGYAVTTTTAGVSTNSVGVFNVLDLAYAQSKNFFGMDGLTAQYGRLTNKFLSTGYYMTATGYDGVQFLTGDKIKFLVGYANFENVFTGFGNGNAAGSANNANSTAPYYTDAIFTNISAPIGDKTTLYGMYLQNTTGPQVVKVWGMGVKAALGDQFTFYGDYTKNQAKFADRNNIGYVAQLWYLGADKAKPGSWGVALEMKKFGLGVGAYSSDWDTSCSSNYVGEKNTALLANWTLAKNIVLSGWQTFSASSVATGAKAPTMTRFQVDFNF